MSGPDKQICGRCERYTEQLQAELTEAKKKIRSLEVTNTNIRLGDTQDWVALRAENKRLREKIDKATDAFRDPINRTAIVDTMWMPDMQATTIAEYLLSEGEER